MSRVLFILFCLAGVSVNAQIITTFAGLTGYHLYTGDEVPATDAALNWPQSVAVDDSGKIYVADFWNARIRVITPDGVIHTFAGNGSFPRSGDGGPATAAGISFPTAIAPDGLGNLYIASDSVTDPYTFHYTICCATIRKVDAAGIITTIAGVGATSFNGDNIPAIGAGLQPISGLAADNLGNIYINEPENRIRKISSAGIITTIAGNGTPGFSGDGGPATDATLKNSGGITLDHSGNIFFADGGNNRIRKIDASGIITTFAGGSTFGYSGDGGPVAAAKISYPYGLAFDNAGNLFFSDFTNDVIRKISNTGVITTVAGTGVRGFSGDGGPADTAKINSVMNVALDQEGNLYLPDEGNENVRMVCSLCPALAAPLIHATDQQFTIFPNPATNELIITAADKITSLTITDLPGRAVYIHEYSSSAIQVNVSDLPKGIYFIKINGFVIKTFMRQ